MAVFGLLSLVAIYALRDGPPPDDPATRTTLSGLAGAPGSSGALGYRPQPSVVSEEKGRIEIIRPAPIHDVQSPMIVQPLFESNAGVKLGEATNLRFAVRDRASGHAAPGGVNMSASVKDGSGPALPLPVEEVEDGIFQVPFTPRGPGQFQVVLSMDGTPIGSGKVGVVGVTGSTSTETDITNSLSVDPRELGARNAGRGRRR